MSRITRSTISYPSVSVSFLTKDDTSAKTSNSHKELSQGARCHTNKTLSHLHNDSQSKNRPSNLYNSDRLPKGSPDLNTLAENIFFFLNSKSLYTVQ